MALQRLGGPLSTFDEARECLAEWERRGLPADEPIVLIYGGDPIVVSVTGEPMRPSCVAGLCTTAGYMILGHG